MCTPGLSQGIGNSVRLGLVLSRCLAEPEGEQWQDLGYSHTMLRLSIGQNRGVTISIVTLVTGQVKQASPM
jgi:hypothetical protein